jgi:hypothetical protein
MARIKSDEKISMIISPKEQILQSQEDKSQEIVMCSEGSQNKNGFKKFLNGAPKCRGCGNQTCNAEFSKSVEENDCDVEIARLERDVPSWMKPPSIVQRRDTKVDDGRWSPVHKRRIDEKLAKKGDVRNVTGGFINMLNEVKERGKLMSTTPGNEWELVSSIVVSGATVPVPPPNIGDAAGYELEESPGSRAGITYEVANGNEIPNLGQKFLAVVIAEGTVRGYSTQCADVTKPLQAVRALMANQHAVVFDSEGCFVFSKVSGELNLMRDDGVNFYLDQWVPKDKLQTVMENLAMEKKNAGFTSKAKSKPSTDACKTSNADNH